MSKLARCSKADPNTCFDASNAQTLTGLCGLSRHLLKTSDRSANRPSAACTITANGPRSWHSPLFSPSCGLTAVVAVAVGAVGEMSAEVAFETAMVAIDRSADVALVEVMFQLVWRALVDLLLHDGELCIHVG